MFRVVEANPLPGFRLRLRFSDGAQGEVNLAHLVGRGVFAAWSVPGAFEEVRVGPHGDIHWGDDLDLCPDALYLEVTAQQPADVFPALAEPATHAGD